MADERVYKEHRRNHEEIKSSDEHFGSAVCGSCMFAQYERGIDAVNRGLEKHRKKPGEPLFRIGAGKKKYMSGRDDFLADFKETFEGRFLSYIELTMRNVETFGGVIEIPGVYSISCSGKEVIGTIIVGEEQKTYTWELPLEVSA